MSYLRVQLRGTLPDGESWSVGVSVFSTALPSTPLSQLDMNTCAAAIGELVLTNALRSLMSTACVWTGVRIEQRTDSGALQTVGEAAKTTPVSGSGNASKPFQTSLVISLRTAVPGRSGRGRIYWPALGASISSTSLRLTGPTPADILDGFNSLFNGIQSAVDVMLGSGTAQIAVRSERLKTENRVNALEVGDILDVQRRRRDKAVETRTSLTR